MSNEVDVVSSGVLAGYGLIFGDEVWNSVVAGDFSEGTEDDGDAMLEEVSLGKKVRNN